MRGFRFLLFAIAITILVPLQGGAQEPAKVHRIGFLWPGSPAGAAASLEALRKGLRDLGYEEGKSLDIAQRYANGAMNKLPALVSDLVAADVAVVITASIPSALAAMKATSTVPIVVGAAGDFVGNGLATSMQNPGGNVTGIDEFVPGLSAKRLELLNETVPVRSPVAVLSSATASTHTRQMEESERVASSIGITLRTFRLSTAANIEPAFASMEKERVQALLVFSGVLTAVNSKTVVEYASKNRLPGMYWTLQFVNDGGLMYYGPKLPRMFERSAALVDRILKGDKAGEIPIEYAKEFELIINLKAAQELGITVPESVLSKADRVIR